MILGLTGMPCAGKGTISDFLKEKGFGTLVFSDPLREELTRQGIPIERKSMQELANKMRAQHGNGILAQKLLEKAEKGKDYVLDGVRNPSEIIELRKRDDFFLVSVDAPQMLRYARECERKRESQKTFEEFKKLDEKDFGSEEDPSGQQVGKCMEMADFSVYNDSELGELIDRIKEILDEIKEN